MNTKSNDNEQSLVALREYDQTRLKNPSRPFAELIVYAPSGAGKTYLVANSKDRTGKFRLVDADDPIPGFSEHINVPSLPHNIYRALSSEFGSQWWRNTDALAVKDVMMQDASEDARVSNFFAGKILFTAELAFKPPCHRRLYWIPDMNAWIANLRARGASSTQPTLYDFPYKVRFALTSEFGRAAFDYSSEMNLSLGAVLVSGKLSTQRVADRVDSIINDPITPRI